MKSRSLWPGSFDEVNTGVAALKSRRREITYPENTGKMGPARMQTDLLAIFNLRRRSLIRGNVLVFASLLIAVPLSDFPHNRATLLLILPTASAVAGTAETVRCLQRRWSFYHAGVMFCVYMDLMAISIIVFLLVYPYWRFLSAAS